MADEVAMRARAVRTGSNAARAAVENASGTAFETVERDEKAPCCDDADAADADDGNLASLAAAVVALIPTASAESEATSSTNSDERSAIDSTDDSKARFARLARQPELAAARRCWLAADETDAAVFV